MGENRCRRKKCVYNKLIDQLIDEKYTMRWVGTMVADCHRTLIKGGIFAYPADDKKILVKLDWYMKPIHLHIFS